MAKSAKIHPATKTLWLGRTCHMLFDFKPESWTGILLLTGETDGMTGDDLALLLRYGYVELK